MFAPGSMLALVTSEVPPTLRGAALLGLVVAGGLVGLAGLVAIAWMRRRRHARRGGGAGRNPGATTDPWSESARRVRVDPESGDSWPPDEPRRRPS